MRFLIAFAFAACLVTGAASAQVRTTSPARTQSVPFSTVGQSAEALQRTADQKWNAVFAADRSFTQSLREAVAAEIAARRARGESVADLEAELQRLNQNTENGLYYLQMQNSVNGRNREFATISNLMRAKHEANRNAISNIR